MVKLIALKSHSPDGITRYRVGDIFEISEASAKFLIKTKHAKPYTKATIETRDMKAVDDADKEAAEHPKGTYRRRDLRAEK